MRHIVLIIGTVIILGVWGLTAAGGSIHASPAQTPTATVTPTPTLANPFEDNIPLPLSCGARVHHTTVGAPSHVSTYRPCRPYWDESGPERLYSLYLQAAQPVTITLLPDDMDVDLDLFLLESLSPDTCLAAGDTYLRPGEGGMPDTLERGLYYLVVDGYGGDAGAYTLYVD